MNSPYCGLSTCLNGAYLGEEEVHELLEESAVVVTLLLDAELVLELDLHLRQAVA